MKKYFISLLCFLLFMNLCALDINQEEISRYKLDSACTSILAKDSKASKLNIYQQNNEIYFLGWSKDGKIAYIENRAIEGRGGHDLYFFVLDLVEDNIVFQKKVRMYDDDSEYSQEKALTFKQCITANSDEINAALIKNEIILTPCQFQQLPAKDKNEKTVDFEIKILKKETGDFNLTYMSYNIIASKENQIKTVNSINDKNCEFVKATGYIKSPYENRIALIVADAEFVSEGDEVFISFYGCNLATGFKNK